MIDEIIIIPPRDFPILIIFPRRRINNLKIERNEAQNKHLLRKKDRKSEREIERERRLTDKKVWLMLPGGHR